MEPEDEGSHPGWLHTAAGHSASVQGAESTIVFIEELFIREEKFIQDLNLGRQHVSQMLLLTTQSFELTHQSKR